MANTFEIFAEDSVTGAPSVGAQINLYNEITCTTPVVSSPPNASGVWVTDANGVITVLVAGYETIYSRQVGGTEVIAWRCVNFRDYADYSSTTPGTGDIFLIKDNADGVIKRVTFDDLLTALITAISASNTYVQADGVPKITANTTSEPANPQEGQVYIKMV